MPLYKAIGHIRFHAAAVHHTQIVMEQGVQPAVVTIPIIAGLLLLIPEIGADLLTQAAGLLPPIHLLPVT